MDVIWEIWMLYEKMLFRFREGGYLSTFFGGLQVRKRQKSQGRWEIGISGFRDSRKKVD